MFRDEPPAYSIVLLNNYGISCDTSRRRFAHEAAVCWLGSHGRDVDSFPPRSPCNNVRSSARYHHLTQFFATLTAPHQYETQLYPFFGSLLGKRWLWLRCCSIRNREFSLSIVHRRCSGDFLSRIKIERLLHRPLWNCCVLDRC